MNKRMLSKIALCVESLVAPNFRTMIRSLIVVDPHVNQ